MHARSRLTLVALILLTSPLSATDLLYENGFDDPTRIKPLFPRMGSMQVVDGTLRIEHRRGHAASPTLPLRFTDGDLSAFDSSSDGAQRLICRFEDESRVENAHGHLCRLEIKPKVTTLRLDRPPKDPGHREETLFATHRQDLADDRWHTAEIRFVGDTFTATIDGQTELEGTACASGA